jgi:UDP-N-acetylglucosamine/UDP-N-acetylgalactosamine diphosphorylase
MDLQTLFPDWNSLDPEQKKTLKEQIESFDLEEIERQRSLIFNTSPPLKALSVFTNFEKIGNLKDLQKGEALIQEGKVGCLIVAGGQGSRLGYKGPKGCCPVTIIKKKSIFQLFAEKILAASIWAKRPLSVAIMTSLENHNATLDFFKQHNFFGLSPDQLFFFSQKEIPFLDTKGHLFLKTKNHFCTGPDGNASSLKSFVDSGLFEKWRKQGICYLRYLHIDNPLADPFDAELIGYHAKNPSSEVIIQSIFRENPKENLGTLFSQNKQILVVEYSEISLEDREKKGEDGHLKNRCANIGLYSFSMNFIEQAAHTYYDKLAFHKSLKTTDHLSETWTAWKFEKFIFDLLPFAQEVKALIYPREECFAPLKNREGEDSLSFVQAALQKRDRDVFEKISGSPPTNKPIELDPAFYYPTLELLQTWREKKLPQDPYVEPYE